MGSDRVLAIIPFRGSDATGPDGRPLLLRGRPLFEYTIEAARAAASVDRVVVSTDSAELVDLARAAGAEAPFVRPSELAASGVPLGSVLAHCLDRLRQDESYEPEVVVLLESSHPLRPPGVIDRVVELLVDRELDTVFVARVEHGDVWRESADGELEPLTRVDGTTEDVYVEVGGLATAFRTEIPARGELLGARVGVVRVDDPRALVDTQRPQGLILAEELFDYGR